MISWRFRSGSGLVEKELSESGNTLVIENVQNTEQYEGDYTCFARSKAGEDQATASLTVYGKTSLETNRPTGPTDRPTDRPTDDRPTDRPTKPTDRPTDQPTDPPQQTDRPPKPIDRPNRPTDLPNRPPQPTDRPLPTDHIRICFFLQIDLVWFCNSPEIPPREVLALVSYLLTLSCNIVQFHQEL